MYDIINTMKCIYKNEIYSKFFKLNFILPLTVSDTDQ